eukprot:PhM_4_TR2642/c0_g1_i1/m.76439
MGPILSLCKPTPTTPIAEATKIFLSHWEKFYGGESVTVEANMTLAWDHQEAHEWGQQRINDIQRDMEEKGVGASFSFNVEGTELAGFVNLLCESEKGATFNLKVNYETQIKH